MDAETTFIDCVLELDDVTGDGVPEIVFHTGSNYADGFSRVIHILHYDGTRAYHPVFRDIGGPQFCEGEFDRVGWLTYAGHSLVIATDSEDPEPTETQPWCVQCPKYHRYEVYEWDRRRQRMVRRTTIPHTKTTHGDWEDPFQVDRDYILTHLRQFYGVQCGRRASSRQGGGNCAPPLIRGSGGPS